MANEMVLATPVMRGKTDGITSYEEATATKEGQAFSLNENGGMIPFDGSKPVKGVAGYSEPGKRRSGILQGLATAVLVDTDATPVIGEKVYLNPATGFFTSVSAGMTETRATWASTKGKAINARTNSIVENCASIDFEGGLRNG